MSLRTKTRVIRFVAYAHAAYNQSNNMARGFHTTDPSDYVILAVDDEPVVLRVIQGILGRCGYKVLAARNGEEACELFNQAPQVDLLFTDVVMPGISGPELAELLLASNPGLRILFTAGMPDSPLIRAGVRDRGFELIPKPFLPAELSNRIRKVLDTPNARAAAQF